MLPLYPGSSPLVTWVEAGASSDGILFLPMASLQVPEDMRTCTSLVSCSCVSQVGRCVYDGASEVLIFDGGVQGRRLSCSIDSPDQECIGALAVLGENEEAAEEFLPFIGFCGCLDLFHSTPSILHFSELVRSATGGAREIADVFELTDCGWSGGVHKSRAGVVPDVEVTDKMSVKG